jgi:dTDP-4-dehydrorhamnose 3,5-epimerase
MEVRELAVPGAWEFTPRLYPDDRGVFLEWFRADVVNRTIGHTFEIAQSNQSVSRRGSVRGIHYADVPPSQAKYVYCPRGAVLDVVVDIRAGSPTFGVVDTVRLDDVDRRAVYLSEGLGHAFCALEDDTTAMYLCTAAYDPTGEHGIHPLDPEVGLVLPDGVVPLLSAKDEAAPSLAQATASGLLPTDAGCDQWARTLAQRSN